MRCFMLGVMVTLMACNEHPSETLPQSENQLVVADSSEIRVGRGLEKLGRACYGRAAYDSALWYYDSALTVMHAIPDTVGIGSVWFFKARAYENLGNDQAGTSAWKQAIAYRRCMFPDTVNALGKAVASLAFNYTRRNLIDSAITYFELADSVMRARGAKAFDKGILYSSMSALYIQASDNGRVVDYALRARSILGDSATQVPASQDRALLIAGACVNLCSGYSELDEHASAIEHGEQAVRLADSLLTTLEGQKRQLALETKFRALTNLVDPYARSLLKEKALQRSEQALVIAREFYEKEPIELTAACSNVALQAYYLERFAQASQCADEAIALLRAHQGSVDFEEHGNTDQLPSVYMLRGLLFAQAGDNHAAKTFRVLGYDELSKRHGQPSKYPSVHALRGLLEEGRTHASAAELDLILYDQNKQVADLDSAIVAIDKALLAAKRLLGSADLTNRSLVAGTLWNMFALGIRVHTQAYDRTKEERHLGKVLDFMETAKNARVAKGRRAWFRKLPVDARKALRQLDSLEQQLFALEASRSAPLDSLERKRRNTLALRNSIGADNRSIGRLMSAPPTTEVTAVRSLLASGEVLFEYHEDVEGMYGIGISHDSCWTWYASKAQYNGWILTWLEGMRSGRPIGDSIRLDLSAALLRLPARMSRKRLIIVPDGVLWGVPFEELINATDISHAEDDVVVRYGSSVEPFVTKNSDQVWQNEYVGFAPGNFDHQTNESGGDAMATREIALVDLPGTIEEVMTAVDFFGGAGFVKERANEANFRQRAVGARIIQLATHAFADRLSPERSTFFLHGAGYRADIHGHQDDGKISVDEIMSMNLVAELAILSACETNAGLYKRGDGVQSFARAFQYAGVPNIISSLWKVDDLATKEIMVKFYEHLADGIGKADALAEAKRWYRRTYPNEPPSKWAAFILIGDNEPVRLKKRSPVRPWMIALGAIVLLGAAWAYRQRTIRRAA